jgi:hypothetical protein
MCGLKPAPTSEATAKPKNNSKATQGSFATPRITTQEIKETDSEQSGIRTIRQALVLRGRSYRVVFPEFVFVVYERAGRAAEKNVIQAQILRSYLYNFGLDSL